MKLENEMYWSFIGPEESLNSRKTNIKMKAKTKGGESYIKREFSIFVARDIAV